MKVRDIIAEATTKPAAKVPKKEQVATYQITPKRAFTGNVAKFGSEISNKILGQQLSKVELVTKALGVTWKKLYYRVIQNQTLHYQDFRRYQPNPPTTTAKTYVLVGTTPKGTEVAYHKHEGGTAGGSSSMIYFDKDPKSKTYLSTFVPGPYSNKFAIRDIKALKKKY